MDAKSDNWFYDNLLELHKLGLSKETFIEVERIYCLSLNSFTSSDWSLLSEAYQSLPKWIGYEEVPYWFGRDEKKPPFLMASVEPSGLQVYGILDQIKWQDWDLKFRESVKYLPKQNID